MVAIARNPHDCCKQSFPGEPCESCIEGTTPASVRITLSGATDGSCECSDLNGVYVLDQNPELPCFYPSLGTGVPVCGFGDVQWFVTASIIDSIVEVAIESGIFGSAHFQFDAGDTPFNCAQPRTLSLVTGGTPGGCDFSGASVEFQPL